MSASVATVDTTSAADVHATTIAGIPGLIALPEHVVPSTPLVLMYHGFGPPGSPETLSKAMPPLAGAITFYPWLPWFGPRLGAGGMDDLAQRQSEDYIGRLLFPVMRQVAGELPRLVDELSATFHLSSQRPLVIFGFSAGGAATLLSLTDSALHPQALIVLNAPLSITQAVVGYERQVGRPYAWTKEARVAAARYDVAAHASQIARRHIGASFLFLQSDHDAGYQVGEAHTAAERLRQAASKFSPEPDIMALDVADADHHVLDPAAPKDAKGRASESNVRALIADWIARHAVVRPPQSNG